MKNIDKDDFIYLMEEGFKNIDLANYFNCSISLIEKKKQIWNLSTGNWNKHDITLLKQYAKEGYTQKEVAILLKRTISAIKSKVLKENICFTGRKDLWSKTELNTLCTNIIDRKSAKYISILLNRSEGAVQAKATDLNLNFTSINTWSSRETNILKTNNHSVQYLINKLNRSEYSIRSKLAELKIYIKGHYWKESEITLLYKLALEKYTAQEIGVRLKRTKSSIKNKTYELGIKLYGKPLGGYSYLSINKLNELPKLTLYIVELNNSFQKIGITKDIRRRFKEFKPFNVTQELVTMEFNPCDAIIAEKYLHEFYKDYKYIPKYKFGGHSECFKGI